MAKKTTRRPVAVFIKDTHLSPQTIEINKSIYKQVMDYCVANEIQKVIHAGDIFTSRASQPLEVLKTFSEILKDFSVAGLHLSAIPGNHDKTDLESEFSYLEPFATHPQFYVYNKESFIFLSDTIILHYLPYFKEHGSYLERLSELQSEEDYFNILVTHIAVTGVKNNDGSSVENGIKKELFDQFDMTLVGHYHDESWIGDKIWYFPGAYQANFGENDKKGFVVLYSDHSFEFVPTVFPKYIKLKVDISNAKEIKRIQKEYADSPDRVRVILTGDETQLGTVNKSKFTDLGIDVSFEKEIARQDLSAVLEDNTVFNNKTIKDAFNHFCETNDFEDVEVGIKYLRTIL